MCLVSESLHDAQGQTNGFLGRLFFDVAGGMPVDHRRRVAGVDQRQTVSGGIKEGRGQRHKAIHLARMLVKQIVEDGNGSGRVRLAQEAEAGVGRELGHE